MPSILFTNNAATTLASSITDVATSLTVASGKGALFPTISGSDYFYATLANTSGAVEIVKVTARSTDTFTIVRGQDGTSGVAWNTGDKVELRATAAGLTAMAQTANNLSDLASASTARTNLGLGTIATQAASSVSITGGSITGITDLAVADGGTGASTLTSGGYLKGAGTSAITSQTGIPAGDITSGTVGTARLGSGTANSSTYLRGDQTWASISGGVTSLNGQTGAITDTNLYAIGSYVTGRPQNNTVYAVNSTLAGSSLYATSGAIRWVGSGWIDLSDSSYYANTNMYTHVNTGTWRCVSPCGAYQIGGGTYSTGLWVRIS